MTPNLTTLPDDLPVPIDDQRASHLTGTAMPDVTLVATKGDAVTLSALPRDNAMWAVLFLYPRTGRPGESLPEGWDEIPGARGCTPQACSFRDLVADFADLDAQIFGVSTQETAYQLEMANRLHLPYPVLSDADLAMTRALQLPTFEVEGMVLMKRAMLFVRRGRIEHVVYPVFPPDKSADLALSWLRSQTA